MITPVFLGTANTKGTVEFENSPSFRSWVASLAGQVVEVIVRPKRRMRSLKANAYYWAVVVATIGNHLGYTKDECHDALAWKFLREGEPDAPLPKRRSTAAMSSHDFEDYVSQCKQFAAEKLGIYVPDPNEVDL